MRETLVITEVLELFGVKLTFWSKVPKFVFQSMNLVTKTELMKC